MPAYVTTAPAIWNIKTCEKLRKVFKSSLGEYVLHVTTEHALFMNFFYLYQFNTPAALREFSLEPATV